MVSPDVARSARAQTVPAFSLELPVFMAANGADVIEAFMVYHLINRVATHVAGAPAFYRRMIRREFELAGRFNSDFIQGLIDALVVARDAFV